MELTITAGEALDYGWWEKVCDLKGINVWAVNEGLMNREEKIILTDKDMETLGILTY